jgi:hypothetical protein
MAEDCDPSELNCDSFRYPGFAADRAMFITIMTKIGLDSHARWRVSYLKVFTNTDDPYISRRDASLKTMSMYLDSFLKKGLIDKL